MYYSLAMQIGFDLDRIFINTPPFIPGELISKLYKKKDNGVLLYRIPSKPEQIFRRATHLPLFRPPIEENLAFLRTIPKKNTKLYLISSRYQFLQGATEQLVKKYKLDSIFEKLYFNYENKQPHMFKNEILKKLKLDMYIDDDLSLLQYVAKENPKTKFFWLETDEKENALAHHKSLEKNVFPISRLSNILT
jgi:hypothetical protein